MANSEKTWKRSVQEINTAKVETLELLQIDRGVETQIRDRNEIPVQLKPGFEYNSSIMSQNGTAMLERLLTPVTNSLNVDAARKLIRLKADAKTQTRVNKLARKCNDGELTAEERAEYERFVTVGNLIAILQAKARLLLANC